MRRGEAADPRLLAYHEAGHAVAAWALKRPLAPIALLTEADDSDGDAAEVTDPEAAEGEALVWLAGVEAEALLTGDYDWWAAAADRERAEGLLARLLAMGWRVAPRDEAEAELLAALDGDGANQDGKDEARSAWALLLHRTHELLRQDPVRSAITALAAALQTQGRIEPQDAQRIIRRGIAAADPDLL